MIRLLQNLLTASARCRPDAAAVTCNGETWSYADLDRRSNQLARALQAAGCRSHDRVAFMIPKSPQAVLAIMGILKAGCAYVPIDPASPPARVARILESSEPHVVLAAQSTAKALPHALDALSSEHRPRVASLSAPQDAAEPTPLFTQRDLHPVSDADLEAEVDHQALAYILYTSGSTGEPKGVAVRHASVLHFVQWANRYFQLGPQDRVSGTFPLHFDLSVYDLFGTFAAGAHLHLLTPDLMLLPHRLAEYVREQQLTQWFSVPSLMAYVARFDVLRPDDFPALRRVLCCGEVLPAPVLSYWMHRLPHVQFTNLYGPTEATIASSYYTVPEPPVDETTAIPIGRPCDGEEIVVLADGARPVTAGDVGELCIGGGGLAQGYWRDPQRTAASFIRDPRPGRGGHRLYRTGDLGRLGADGTLQFIGRADSQIKSRGYRIELGEVEAALGATGLVHECAVVGLPTDRFESWTICCAYTPVDALKGDVATLRRALSRRLPGYMVPTRWSCLERLPRNSSDKIDRAAVRDSFTA